MNICFACISIGPWVLFRSTRPSGRRGPCWSARWPTHWQMIGSMNQMTIGFGFWLRLKSYGRPLLVAKRINLVRGRKTKKKKKFWSLILFYSIENGGRRRRPTSSCSNWRNYPWILQLSWKRRRFSWRNRHHWLSWSWQIHCN